MIAMPSPPAP